MNLYPLINGVGEREAIQTLSALLRPFILLAAVTYFSLLGNIG